MRGAGSGERGASGPLLDRRSFVGLAGAALAAAAAPSCLADASSGRERLDRIGLQLYTVRDLLARDFDGTLDQVAAIGYREVEFAGYRGKTPAEVAAALQRTGLAAPSAHVPFEALRAGWPQTLDLARSLGHRYVVVAWIPAAERATIDAWRRLAGMFNQAGAEAQAMGLQFAFHNHDYEFVPLEGQIPYDVLLAETDAAAVALEVDLYWITKGGRDPLAYFARYPGRVPMVHVKDSAGAPEHRMVDVGSGTIDWRRIFARSTQAGIRHYFVEHDQPPDPVASITRSYQYLKQLRF